MKSQPLLLSGAAGGSLLYLGLKAVLQGTYLELGALSAQAGRWGEGRVGGGDDRD